MSLLSIEFLGLAAGVCLWMQLARGALRDLGFLAAGLVFAASHLAWSGLFVLGALCALAWLASHWVARRPRALPLCVGILVGLFLWLRHYSFVDALLPDDWRAPWVAAAGLSFLLFKLLHVLVDVAAGTLAPPRPLAFLAYCFNFTAFLLGPIQRYGDFLEQLEGRRAAIEPELEAQLVALNRVLRGLVKKFVLAEFLAPFALLPGEGVEGLTLLEALRGVSVFYVYLYCDFAGYCDVMIGVGSLCGVRPPENFRFPFLATNITSFWQRAHRSLTTWLTDYVFNPLYASLLRSRRWGAHPQLAMHLSLVATMLVSGVWHGTSASFVLFGALHGLYHVVHRAIEALLLARLGRAGLTRLRARKLWAVLGVALTLPATAFAYLPFVLELDELVLLFSGGAA